MGRRREKLAKESIRLRLEKPQDSGLNMDLLAFNAQGSDALVDGVQGILCIGWLR